MSERKPGYFNEKNYYSFEMYEGRVTIESECCADSLNMDAAIELRGLLDEYIGWTDGR